MSVSAVSEVAMVLPIPVLTGTMEEAVSFISLEGFPGFFDEIEVLFEEVVTRGAIAIEAPLIVHNVGAYEASYVPSLRAFSRLDERFQLSDDVWQQLPDYHDWGFAVFKLRGLAAGTTTAIHPMAFIFPTRQPDRLFFPTVHIHDGEIHHEAFFDHGLYSQAPEGMVTSASDVGWDVIPEWAGEQSHGLLESNQLVFKRTMVGQQSNRDTWLQFEPMPTGEA